MTNQTRNCRMCGLILPPHYETNWCWMCWRRAWEKDYDRYYLKTEAEEITLWEEVQSLRGVNAFNENNEPLIKEAIKKEREILTKKKQNEPNQ